MERNEQLKENIWDLGSLCRNEKEWARDMKKLEKRIPELKALKGTLGESVDSLLKAYQTLESFFIELERLGSFAFLQYEADSTNPEVMKRAGMVDALEAKVGEATSFLDPELLALSDDFIKAALKDRRMKPYKVAIEKSRRFKEHVLSEKEEQLLSYFSPVSGGFREAYMDLDNADIDFGEFEGEHLTHSSYAKWIRSEDEDVRRRAYLQFYKGYESHQHVIARLYGGSIKKDIFTAKARGYKSSLEKALFPDKVNPKVYRNLIKSIHEAFPVLHHYYEVKARCLGKDKLKHYDVYMNMVPDMKVSYKYDDAVELIRKAVAPLGKEYQDTLCAGLTTEHWVDKYENKGKRSGAFSAGCFTGKPYILTNYQEEVLNSVFTLIHEGGHSMHSYYSVRNNPFMSYNYTIFEAEVASTTNEQLLANYLIDNTEDRELKKYIIASNLDDIVGTLFRQTMFAEYELICHEAAENGTPLTVDFFRTTYRNLLEQYFGPAVEFEECSDLEGLRIPHFYNAFYTYKYATGISAAIALSQRVLNGGDREREDYLGFLKSGGSTYPINSLKKAGVDMSTPEAIKAATDRFAMLLKTFEELNFND